MGHPFGTQLLKIDTPRAFERMRDVFERVHASDPEAGVHLSWPWLYDLFLQYPGRCRVCAYSPTGLIEDACVFLPLRRDLHWSETRQAFVTRYAAMGLLNIADYTGFVCSDEAAISEFAGLIQAEPWARLSLRFEATGHRARAFAKGFVPAKVSAKWPESRSSTGTIDNLLCPRIPVTGTVADYVVSLGKKMRKKHRRALRQAEQMGAVLQVLSRKEQAEHLTRILDHWAQFWEGKKNADARERLGRRYHEHLTRAMNLGVLHVSVLSAGGRFLGGTASLIDRKQRVLHSIVEGRDDAAGIDGGMLLAVGMVEQAAKMGLAWVDLGHGDHDYKYRLGAQNRQVSYLTLRRRNRGPVPQFDPAMAQMAVEATRGFIRGGQHDKARAALDQLRTLRAT